MEAQKRTDFTEKIIKGWENCSTSVNYSKIMTCRKSVLGPVPALIFRVPVLSAMCPFKTWLLRGSLLDLLFISHMRALSFFPTWEHPNLYLQTPDEISLTNPRSIFPKCTKHLWQEAILLSLTPSCQNIQNWKPCSTHSLLWPVSQLSLTIPPSASLPGQTSRTVSLCPYNVWKKREETDITDFCTFRKTWIQT